MNGYESRLKIKLLLTLFGVLSGCSESTSPTPDVPYTLSVTTYGVPLRLIHSDGATEAELSCTPSCKYQVARWSRDGTRLSLEGTSVEGGVHYTFLYTANADGSSPVVIDRTPAWCSGSHGTCGQIHYRQFDVDWSTDGRLVYILDDTSVVVSRADGSGKRILFSAADLRQARWGPGDQTITFLSRAPNGPANLYSVQSADGSGMRPLGNLNVGYYAWAPDQLSIAVQSICIPPDCHSSLFLTHPVTGESTELLRHPMNGFSWSPRGNEIAFSNSSGDTLYVVERNGNLTPVFQGIVGKPAWSPDGRYVIAAGATALTPDQVSAISRTTGARRIIASGIWIISFSVKHSTRWNGTEGFSSSG